MALISVYTRNSLNSTRLSNLGLRVTLISLAIMAQQWVFGHYNIYLAVLFVRANHIKLLDFLRYKIWPPTFVNSEGLFLMKGVSHSIKRNAFVWARKERFKLILLVFVEKNLTSIFFINIRVFVALLLPELDFVFTQYWTSLKGYIVLIA